jgi:hypothetical protein
MDPLRGPNNKVKVLIPECLGKVHKDQGGEIFFDLGPLTIPGVICWTKMNNFIICYNNFL